MDNLNENPIQNQPYEKPEDTNQSVFSSNCITDTEGAASTAQAEPERHKENYQPSSDIPPFVPPPLPPPPVKNKKRGCFFAFIIALCVIFVGGIILFLICASIFLITGTEQISSLSVPSQSYYRNFKEMFLYGASSSSNKILVIDVSGIITGYSDSIYKTSDSQTICEMLEQANKDEAVKAIILRIDSPGGEVTAADKIHHKILEVRKNKHIVVYMDAIAASGGYYISAPADWIIANKLTLTGSIGVIIQMYNYHNLLGKIGVYTETFKSGPMKDMLDGSKITSEAERTIVQNLVNQVYNEFVKIVAEGRSTKGITTEKIRNTEIGDGRVISGEDALKYGLVDQLGYFEDAIKKSAELAILGDNYKVVYYMKRVSFLDVFTNIKGPENAKISVEMPGYGRNKNWANVIEPGKIYLLPTNW